jgi:hypothetical protein
MTSVLPMSLHDFIGEAVSADLLKSISEAPTQQIMKDLRGPPVPTTPASNRCEDDGYEIVNKASDFSEFVLLK